jgi:phospholipid transport system substrate-binding protein
MRHGFIASLVVGFLLGFAMLPGSAARAANPAETFVAQNVQKGLTILNHKHLSTEQRRADFGKFLIGLTDLNRIARFTLGRYRRTASPADLQAFEAAFQRYAIAFYQSYFAKYSGQTLKVVGSHEKGPGDYVVQTVMIDPHDRSGQPPLEVDFHVRTDGSRPVVVDVAVLGIWVSLTEQSQFTAFLGQNNGSIPLLISHLDELSKGIH